MPSLMTDDPRLGELLDRLWLKGGMNPHEAQPGLPYALAPNSPDAKSAAIAGLLNAYPTRHENVTELFPDGNCSSTEAAARHDCHQGKVDVQGALWGTVAHSPSPAPPMGPGILAPSYENTFMLWGNRDADFVSIPDSNDQGTLRRELARFQSPRVIDRA
jgi:hypothetical protein